MLPNPWDIGTAIYLERLGFEALATTSAGFAFSRGKPDGAVPRDQMLAHIREIVEATALPVNADFLSGYADEPENVAANVQRCIDMGVAGLSIEDNTGRTDTPLYEKKLAVARIRAARAAIDDSRQTGQRSCLRIQSSAVIFTTGQSRRAPHLGRVRSRAGCVGRIPPRRTKHTDQRRIQSSREQRFLRRFESIVFQKMTDRDSLVGLLRRSTID